MPVALDMGGQRFGRWVVLERDTQKRRHPAYLCQCDCGSRSIVLGAALRRGNSQSCGCFKKEAINAFRTHGRSKTPEHIVWMAMKGRCLNPNNSSYASYGGRGITVCDRWKNSFDYFLSDMGMRPSPLHTIERENNDGNYEPNNCRWATRQEQSRNRRTTMMCEWNGKITPVRDVHVSEKSPNSILSVLDRLRNGWPIKEALFAPRSSKLKYLKREARTSGGRRTG